MKKWRNVTEFFSEEQRHYKSMYLEIDEVYDDVVEVSVFSSKDEPYEIYISYDILYGIIYADAKDAYIKFEEVKKELSQEYDKSKKASGKFINSFAEKHNLCLPNDIFFDSSSMFGF